MENLSSTRTKRSAPTDCRSLVSQVSTSSFVCTAFFQSLTRHVGNEKRGTATVPSSRSHDNFNRAVAHPRVSTFVSVRRSECALKKVQVNASRT